MSRARQPRLTWRSAALDPDSGLSWRARFAATVYCEFANSAGVLDPAPSASTLAEWMGVSLTTAHEARRELEAKGWLSIERRSGRPSRVSLSSDGQPLREPQGSERPTPARTPARTPAPDATEPENQITRGEPPPSTNDQLTDAEAKALFASGGFPVAEEEP